MLRDKIRTSSRINTTSIRHHPGIGSTLVERCHVAALSNYGKASTWTRFENCSMTVPALTISSIYGPSASVDSASGVGRLSPAHLLTTKHNLLSLQRLRNVSGQPEPLPSVSGSVDICCKCASLNACCSGSQPSNGNHGKRLEGQAGLREDGSIRAHEQNHRSQLGGKCDQQAWYSSAF